MFLNLIMKPSKDLPKSLIDWLKSVLSLAVSFNRLSMLFLELLYKESPYLTKVLKKEFRFMS